MILLLIYNKKVPGKKFTFEKKRIIGLFCGGGGRMMMVREG